MGGSGEKINTEDRKGKHRGHGVVLYSSQKPQAQKAGLSYMKRWDDL